MEVGGALVAAAAVGVAGGVGLDTGRSRQRNMIYLALGKSYFIAYQYDSPSILNKVCIHDYEYKSGLIYL